MTGFLALQILHHLRPFSNDAGDLSVPRAVSVDGIMEHVSRSRSRVSNQLKRLLAEGLVQEERAHVPGRQRRVRVYFLTTRGHRLLGHQRRCTRCKRSFPESELTYSSSWSDVQGVNTSGTRCRECAARGMEVK